MVGRSVLRGSAARLVPWAVLALGLVTTLVLDHSIAIALKRRHDEEVRRTMDDVGEKIDLAISRQVTVLQATAGLFAADGSIGRTAFAAYYRDLARSKEARLPLTIGLSLFRPWERRAELAADAARRGVPNFRLRPSTPREVAHAIVLAEPSGKVNDEAPGFDMHVEPERRAAMERALATGKAAMTGRVVLWPDRKAGIPGFIVYVPLTTGELGRPGLVFSGLRSEDLWSDLRPPMIDNVFGVRLWSGDDRAKGEVFSQPLGGEVAERQNVRVPLASVGGTLGAEFAFGPKFGPQATIRPYVLPVGTILSVLLFALATVLRRSQEAAARQAAEQSLLAEVGRLTEGTTDSDETLRAIAAAAGRTLEAVCRIDLIEESGTLRTVSTRTEGQDVLTDLEREFPRLEYDVLFREALRSGKPQRAEGYRSASPEHAARIAALGAGAVLLVPLWLGDRAIGAISLVRPKGADAFTPETEALAGAIAGRLALAIENERLYHNLERRVEERTRDLEASNHELESFCYSVSHDLRTPLRSLDGFGRALQEDYGDRLDAQGIDFIERIRASTKRMDELITALLTLSRLTRREILPIEVDVTPIVREHMQDLDPEGRVRLQVTKNLTVHADPRMLDVVLDNLLGNAVKFSSRTESPEIEVGRRDGWLFVRDNGAGFDMAYAAKLFQPFERLHSVREFPGHGIGLATVERIVRRHGGEVRAEGKPGEGATFLLRFPD